MARLPARVYWFRRFMVLAILAAVVFAVLRVAAGGNDSAAPVATKNTPDSQPQQDPAGPDHGDSYGGRSHHESQQQPVPEGNCRTDQIQLTPVVAEGIRVGQAVAIQIGLRTTGDTACRFHLTPDNLVVDITTTQGDPVWTSDECSMAITPTRLVLDTDRPAIVQVTWDGTRSDVHCSPSTVRSAAGDYQVRTAVIGGEPAASAFTLDDALPTQAETSTSPSAGPSSSPSSDPSSSSSSSPSSNQSSDPSSSPSSGHT
jgi:hypothetical protein